MPDWVDVGRADVEKAVEEYDRLGARTFFEQHGYAPTTTYEMVLRGRSYPPKAILGVAYEFATGRRLAPADFEGGRSGAVKVLTALGYTVRPLHRTPG